ncbi:MAG: hypothetical protein H3C34_01815 [Caldilineaceae bacterium]|nr:hypothetical protein [Caldilineaceae bacterium]
MAVNDAHSFIVKIWLEETTAEAGRPTWRGSLTHVATGRRTYFAELDILPRLIRPYLQSMLAESPLPEGE